VRDRFPNPDWRWDFSFVTLLFWLDKMKGDLVAHDVVEPGHSEVTFQVPANYKATQIG